MTSTSAPADIEQPAIRPTFEILRRDPGGAARLGSLRTRRGEIATPTFMPVGTQATVKSLTMSEVAQTGAQIVLSNTYHLMLRPGLSVIQAAGGLHQFMNWPGTILTDSGGYQVFSLARRRRVSESGVEFRSHIDGQLWQLAPETAIDLQLGFGSDIIMPLDELVGFDSTPAEQQSAMERTRRWLERSVGHFRMRTGAINHPPLLFGIAQGGFEEERRRTSALSISELDVDGSAVGGLSVGEPKPVMDAMLAASISGLPEHRPRYLMGVGSPEDLWRAVALGVDMFDCVQPTRVARRGAMFTPAGRVTVSRASFREHFGPVDPSCDCETCREYSAAYLHHLFRAGELLAYRLATIHNLRFMQRQMEAIREAITRGTFRTEASAFLAGYRPAAREE